MAEERAVVPIEPWDRQPGEGGRAYAAFQVYRDLGPEIRSLSKVAKQLMKSTVLIGRWSANHGWVGRCAAWDAENSRVARSESLNAIKTANRRAVLAGQLMSSKGLKRIQNMTEEDVTFLSMWEAMRLVENGMKLERLGLGQAPDGPIQVNVTHSIKLVDLLRRNPEKIGEVIPHLAAIREALPQLAAGADPDAVDADFEEVDDEEDDLGEG